VNLSEVVGEAVERQVDVDSLAAGLAGLGVRIEPFTHRQAEIAGALLPRTRALGLSLGDRACLALALEADLPVLTADRAWLALDPMPAIRLIR
jgi:PIN domain nuclease of toxin-antitoxin system